MSKNDYTYILNRVIDGIADKFSLNIQDSYEQFPPSQNQVQTKLGEKLQSLKNLDEIQSIYPREVGFKQRLPMNVLYNPIFNDFKNPLMVHSKKLTDVGFSITDLRKVLPDDVSGLLLKDYITHDVFWVNRYSKTKLSDGSVNVCVFSTTSNSMNVYTAMKDSYSSKPHTDFTIPTEDDSEDELDITPPPASSKLPVNNVSCSYFQVL